MKAIVLAAGKGKRLQSELFNLPKVLREVNGKPLIKYVTDNMNFVPREDTCIVAGYKRELVMDALSDGYCYVFQEEQLGTGHAAMMAESWLKGYEGDVLVLYGDMPLFRENTYKGIIESHKNTKAGCTLLTAVVNENPPDYGRVIRDSRGAITDIVEKRDCSPEQLNIKELNVGIYVFNCKLLFESLKLLDNNNSQKEYYLTDVPRIMIHKGIMVSSYTVEDVDEIIGVNTVEDLQRCEEVMLKRTKTILY